MKIFLKYGLQLYFLLSIIPFLYIYDTLPRPAIIVVVLQFFIALNFVKRLRITRSDIRFIGIIGTILILILITSIFSINTSEALINLTTYAFSIISLLIILLGSREHFENQFISVMQLFTWIGLIFSIVSIGLTLVGTLVNVGGQSFQQIGLGPIVLRQVAFYKGGRFIGAAFTNNPNTLGVFLMFTLGCTILSYFNQKRFLYMFAFFIQFYALYESDSRTAILGMLFFIIFFALGYFKGAIKIFLEIILLFVFLLVAIVIWANFNLIDWDAVTTNRTWAWTFASQLLKSHMGIGVGFGVAHNLVAENLGIGVHNVFLSLALQCGIPIAGTIVILWAWAIFSSFKLTGQTNKKLIYVYSFAFLLSLLLHQLFEEHVFRFNLISFFWIYIMYIIFTKVSKEAENDKLQNPDYLV